MVYVVRKKAGARAAMATMSRVLALLPTARARASADAKT